MKSQQTIAVVITSSDGQTASGTVEYRAFEKSERTMRGLKALGFAWGGAIVAVFIPLLHFVLVPLLLLGGPAAFFVISGQGESIEGGSGECPSCRRQVRIVKAQVKWPLSDLCNHCQKRLKIEPLNPPNSV